jgi:hypothetical protein
VRGKDDKDAGWGK